MSGGLLAISRKWFFEIGGYDSSMKGWGGENLDQEISGVKSDQPRCVVVIVVVVVVLVVANPGHTLA